MVFDSLCTLEEMKRKIDRYVSLGVEKRDIASMIAESTMSAEKVEEANWYLHESKGTFKQNNKPEDGIRL